MKNAICFFLLLLFSKYQQKVNSSLVLRFGIKNIFVFNILDYGRRKLV